METFADVPTVPDVLRLRLLRLAASAIWQEPDFVRGWYITLWLRLATNEREPGYLRVEDAEIYRAAGARSPEYFQRHASGMMQQYFRRDDSGRLYCPRLLEELKDSRVSPDRETRDVV